MGRQEHHEILRAIVSTTGAATDEEIVAADADERIFVRQITVTCSEDAEITIKSGSTVLFGPTEAIRGFILDDPKTMFTGVNENLNYTTSAGDSNVVVEYFKGMS